MITKNNKIKILVILLIVINFLNIEIQGCSLHNYGPMLPPEHYKDSYFFEYEITGIKSFINIIPTTDFLWIENPQSMFGLYMIPFEDIETINQDGENLAVINIVKKNGEIKNIDTSKQNIEEDNILIGEIIDSVLYMDIKEGYGYLYEIDYYNEKVEQTLKNEGINSNKKINYKESKEIEDDIENENIEKYLELKKNKTIMIYLIGSAVIVGLLIITLLRKR